MDRQEQIVEKIREIQWDNVADARRKCNVAAGETFAYHVGIQGGLRRLLTLLSPRPDEGSPENYDLIRAVEDPRWVIGPRMGA